MAELTFEELEGQHTEILPAREEMLVGFILAELAGTVASTCIAGTTTILGKTVLIVVC